MRFLEKLQKDLVALRPLPSFGIGGLAMNLFQAVLHPEEVVDMAIIRRVVLVHALGQKDGIEIDRRDTKLAEIRKLFTHALNIPAVPTIKDEIQELA